MPYITTGDIQTYYEIRGNGPALVFIHGAWVSRRMWQGQLAHFSQSFRVITYDVRGHGLTGGSSLDRYSMELFADDLSALLKALDLKTPVICGLSMGGMVAQSYAVKYVDDLRALILADTAISSSLTLSDKLIKYVLGPKWFFTLLVRLLGVKRYADFAFWYARKSRSNEWVGAVDTIAYEKEEMVQFETGEFNKIFSALYDFSLLPLSRIKVPVLIVNGQYESNAVFTHTAFAEKSIPDVRSVTIPQAGHSSNLENPRAFNQVVAEFLEGLK
jgi:pimeloyl-ACP methyl ester carboxylesterase